MAVLSILAMDCGILNPQRPIYDPEFSKQKLAEINSRPENIKRDSLLHVIDIAPLAFPTDLTQQILICELLDYEAYLNLGKNKLDTTLRDTKRMRRYFEKYSKEQNSLLKGYKYKKAYLNRQQYDSLNKDEYRYVLKTMTRLRIKDEDIKITLDGHAAWVATIMYYIYDRKLNVVYKEIGDLSTLTSR